MTPWPPDRPGPPPADQHPTYPAYPAYPRYQQNPYHYAHPQHPQYPPPYGYPPYPPYPLQPGPAPSGASAITAAVLSFLGALVAGLGVVVGFVAAAQSPGGSAMAVAIGAGVFGAGIAAALLIGGILLLRRKTAGRVVIAVACGLIIVLTAGSLLMSVVYARGVDGSPGAGLGRLMLLQTVHLVFPVLTLVLALLPATGRWCRAKRPPAPTAW